MKHGLHEECFAKWFEIQNPLCDFENITLKQASKEPTKSDIGRMNTSFFHGAFKKYSAEIEGQHYILKVSQNDFPELPLVEWISNKIANLIGLKTADFYLIRLGNVQKTFVTKNFITSKNQAMNLVHIYHFLTNDEVYNCENILKVVNEKSGKLADVKEIIYMCLFDALIGNHDRHGRNIALIQTGPSNYTLSPTYDNPSYIGIESEFLLQADLNPKGKIFTMDSSEPTLKDYLIEFSRLGHQEMCKEFISITNKKWDQILSTIEKSELSDHRKTAFKKILNKRKMELKLE